MRLAEQDELPFFLPDEGLPEDGRRRDTDEGDGQRPPRAYLRVRQSERIDMYTLGGDM